jgi:hypothetical protein
MSNKQKHGHGSRLPLLILLSVIVIFSVIILFRAFFEN